MPETDLFENMDEDDAFEYDEFLSGIERYGYLEYVPEKEMARVKKGLARGTWPFLEDGSRRKYYLDADDLAEKGGATFIKRIQPFLENQGVRIDGIEEYFDDEYRITLNGKETVIWSSDEAEAETAGKPVATWGLTMVRIFAVVNELLEQAGSEERLYAVGGEGELDAVFLTPELVDFMCGSLQVMVEDRPYIPVSEYPMYGQPFTPD